MPFFLRLFFSSLAVFFLAAFSFQLHAVRQQDIVLPRTIVGNLDFSGLNRVEAEEVIQKKLEEFANEPFTLAARGSSQQATLQELGVTLNAGDIFEKLPFSASYGNASLFFASIGGIRIEPEAAINSSDVLRVIHEKFPDIPQMKNAGFVRERKTWMFQEGAAGAKPNPIPTISAIKTNIAFLEHEPLAVELTDTSPTVFVADLEPYREEIIKQFSRAFKLQYEKQKWAVDFSQHLDWLIFDKKSYELAEGEFPFSVTWDPVAFSKFVNENLTKSLEQSPDNVRIFRDQSEDGKIQFDGRAIPGQAILRERLLTLVNDALSQKSPPESIEIPLVVVEPKVEVSDDLQMLGIRELVAVGHTRFKGSPVNRRHNIGVGISKFNGILVPPGEIFSFNKYLGRVDASTGYRKELVIKPEGTIPDYGGGLCQVSSTMYRAAIYGGFSIVERAPHSYAVTYYSQIGGHGLDATIYPPSRDLKFKNDSPAHILIQSYVDGDDAFFKFYGTSDGRKVEMEGPIISNQRAAPTNIIETRDPNLPPGERKQVEKPHGGFDALWYRTIIKNGETTKEEIFTRYNAVPAKFMIGNEVSAEGENSGLVDAPE